ncbi:glycosyltransferase [Desulfuromonas sp. KJ2020]|uniref:glycosyltransferase n=1 Tax=Desulfuromonas sp. KJ2020 TaxID=2919173 RepID=UPI0020A745F1|nr:glycosyltransferase [Desulfuromonas sp. KJ2020]MCP3178429.1 glycosyltransferase [Desulfuromonas sp. KJ2020]
MNNASPLVSIGVAIYNEEKFLRRALESILSQDYPNIEIIICDNASTDKTPSICEEFAEKYAHVSYYRSDENVGAHANGFKAIHLAKGKYYMYAPGHDLWDPSFVSKAVSLMEEDPEVVLCYSRTMRIDTEGNPLGLANNSWDLRGLSPVERLTYLVNHLSGGDPCNGLIRLKDLKKFDRKFVWGFDQVMLAYFTLAGSIAHIPESLFFWRVTDDENVEVRRATVPQDNDPGNSRKLLNMSMMELWRQMGEATLAVVNESDLDMSDKLACKEAVRQCFTRRYGVQWNEVIPSELNPDGQNVLLVTSAPPQQTPFYTTEKRPPIGVGFLIAVLRDAGHNVFFIDNYLKPSDFLETDYLQRHQIDMVGIYTNTICFRDSLRMIRRLDAMRQNGTWQGRIVVGGPHASVSPQTIPECVDHIVLGEGEYALRDIVAGKVQERIVQYPPIKDLDSLPMPAWDYFADMPYNWGGNWLPEGPVFTMNTSRGCPFDCTFCSVGSIWGRRYVCFSPERIVAEIEHLKTNYGVRGIYFREDNFTLNKKRLEAFCQLMVEREVNIPWVCETRASSLDEETVDMMAKAGAKGAYIGVESGSQRLLDFMHKDIKLEDVRRAFRLCREKGINTAASMIVGVPGETEDDLRKSQELLVEIKPTVTWFNIFVGIPDSNLYKHVLENRLYQFIDDRGLVYLHGHNSHVDRYYGGDSQAKIPFDRSREEDSSSPKVSVLLSVYNGEKYLPEALDSIFAQTFQDFELIVVDDGSTDRTPEILLQYRDSRTLIYRNQENMGLTRSLNLGLKFCRGDYVARMDADDISAPQRLERQVRFLEENPDHALVGSSYCILDDDGKKTGLVEVLTDSESLKKGLIQQNWFGHGSVVMRRKALESVGGYNEEYLYAQDYDLFLRISEHFEVANLSAPLFFWRKALGGISQRKAQEQQAFAQLARREAIARRQRLKSGARESVENKPKVSVIVPTYNRLEILREALQSILAQSYHDFEIIVVNDAGAPVEEVIASLDVEGRITYVRHSLNKGLAAARNTGIQNARGKYIAYLDDDDIFFPNHIELLVNHLESSGDKIAYTDAYRGYQEKQGDQWVVTRRDIPYSLDFDSDRILVDNFVPVLCFMHERSVLDEVGGFDETLKRHEDWDLWIRVSSKYRPYHLKQVTCEFRSRSDGSSMTGGQVGEFYKTCQQIYKKYADWVADKPSVRRAQEANLVNYQVNQALELSKGVNNLTTGIRRLEELLVSWPQMATVHNALGYLHAQAANRAKAIKYLKEAVRLEPQSELYRNNLAIVVSSPDNAGTDKESNAKTYLEKGEQAFGEGDFDLAALYFERLLGIDENNLDALNNLGVVAFKQGQVAEARRFFERCLRIKPGFDEALQNLQMCDKARETNAGDLVDGIEALLRRGEELFGQGDLDGASDCFLQVLHLDAAHIEALNNLGVVAIQVGQSEDALVFVDKALAINPYFVQALENRAAILHHLGRDKDAETVDARLSAVRGDVEKLIAVGEEAFVAGDIVKASQAFDSALAFDPQQRDALNNLGVIAYQQGEVDDARALFEKCLHSDPDFAEARQNLQMCDAAPEPALLEATPDEPPYFSVITCSIDDEKFARLQSSLFKAFKEPVELIRIDDARSLCEGYNRGLLEARGEAVVFCHDDIEFLNENLGERLRQDLEMSDLVGVAGTTRLVEGSWIAAGQPHIHGQVAHLVKDRPGVISLCMYGNGRDPEHVTDVQALDGLFFAVKRPVLEQIRFDEATFDGFHLYDLDFTYAAYLKGFHLMIDHGIHLLHASGGNYDQAWSGYAEAFNQKYRERLATREEPVIRFFKGLLFDDLAAVKQEMARYPGLNALRYEGGQLSLNSETEGRVELDTVASLPLDSGNLDYARLVHNPNELGDKVGVMRELARALRPGGVVEILLPLKKKKGGRLGIPGSWQLGDLFGFASNPPEGQPVVRHADLRNHFIMQAMVEKETHGDRPYLHVIYSRTAA